MNVSKNILIVLASAVAVLQLTRPEKNVRTAHPENELSRQFPVPAEVNSILRRSCYDCHSSTTVYPWYAEVQPVGWWLNGHIQDGKRQVNFDEFAGYRPYRQYRKFRDVIEQIEKDEMPLPSYTLIHTYAKLSAEEKTALIQWSKAMMDSMKAQYPADSLERRRRN